MGLPQARCNPGLSPPPPPCLQVKECLKLAEKGLPYDLPPTKRAVVVAADEAGAQQQQGGGDAQPDPVGQQAGDGGAGTAKEGTGGDVGSKVLDRHDVGRVLEERSTQHMQLGFARARDGVGTGLLTGAVVWAAALLVLVVVWCRQRGRRGGVSGRGKEKAKYAE